MKNMKILYIIDQLGAGGKERRMVQLLRGLQDDERISPKVVLLTDVVHYREIFDLGFEIIILDRKIKKDPAVFFKIHKICKNWKPDIIHAWGTMPTIYAGPVAKLLGIKLINASIADAPLKVGPLKRLRTFISFCFSDIIQSNSHAGLKAYKVPPAKGLVIYNGFDFSRIKDLKDKGRLREEFKIDTDHVVGMVAGLNFHKDYRSLINAAKKILEKRSDVSFICVGTGIEMEDIKKISEPYERIIFTGRRNDVESIVDIFTVGILLTNMKIISEGISNSIMEYMACGKPVIATRGGGTVELVKDGETGFLIPNASPEELAEKIELLLNNPGLRREMGEKGRERIEMEFNLDRMIRKHVEVYEKVCKL